MKTIVLVVAGVLAGCALLFVLFDHLGQLQWERARAAAGVSVIPKTKTDMMPIKRLEPTFVLYLDCRPAGRDLVCVVVSRE